MSDATGDKSFGLVLTAINEVHKRIFYMTYDIFLSSKDGCTI